MTHCSLTQKNNYPSTAVGTLSSKVKAVSHNLPPLRYVCGHVLVVVHFIRKPTIMLLMSKLQIINIGPKPPSTYSLIRELLRRLLHRLEYYITSIYFTARRLPANVVSMLALLLALFGAFKSERMLPGADPTEYCDPIPQLPSPLVPTLDEYISATCAVSKPSKPAKFKNQVGQLPQGYDVYGVAVWHLIAHESFRPYRYADGKYPSTAFGLNLTPSQKEWGAKILGLKSFPNHVTWDQGKILLRAYIEQKLAPQFPDNGLLTPQQRVAKIVHAYNRGLGSADNVANCCGGRKGCGSRDKNIRSSHTARRIWETLAWQGKLTKAMIEKDRAKAIAKQQEWQ